MQQRGTRFRERWWVKILPSQWKSCWLLRNKWPSFLLFRPISNLINERCRIFSSCLAIYRLQDTLIELHYGWSVIGVCSWSRISKVYKYKILYSVTQLATVLTRWIFKVYADQKWGNLSTFWITSIENKVRSRYKWSSSS